MINVSNTFNLTSLPYLKSAIGVCIIHTVSHSIIQSMPHNTYIPIIYRISISSYTVIYR